MMDKILLLSLPGMGDTIMFSPVIRRLRAAYPSAFIAAVTMHASSFQVLELDPALDRVERFAFMEEGAARTFRFMLRLRRERFDACIVNYPSNRWEYHLVTFLSGARKRAVHRYRHESIFSLPWLNNVRITEEPYRHNVDENLALTDALGVPGCKEPVRPYITLDDDDRAVAERFLAEKGMTGKTVIGFHPWSTELKNMHRKCWPPERFGTLAARLAGHGKNVATLVFKGPHDCNAVRRILDACGPDAVPAVAEGLSVRQSAAVLERCRLLVSNDSGVMHLGEAVGTPCLGLFGPTDPRKTSPYDRSLHRVAVAAADLPCRPCFYYSPRPLRCRAGIDYRCMSALDVERVAVAAAAMLGEEA